jgi:predicted ATPase
VWEEEGAPVYWPWLIIMRQLLDSHDIDWLRQRLGTDAAVVAQVVLEVAERLPGLSEPPRLEPTQDRFRLFDSLTKFLKRAVSDRPLVLVLDDLHRADDSTLLLLRFLTRDLGDARLLVVATYRDSPADQREEFVRTLAYLTREPVTSRLVLAGFDKGEVARFVALAAGMAIPDAFAAKLQTRTSGNPLFLKEIVLPLADGSDPAEFEDGLDDFVPQGVQEAVERRLAYIPSGARDVLDKASVIGQQFTLEVLGEVTELDHPQLLGLLDEVVGLDYVTLATGSDKNRFRFAHVLIRDALFRRLPAARRAILHQRVGEALEKVYAHDLEGRYIELAHHFMNAAGEAGSRKSLDYLQLAGEQAAARFAYADAERLFEGALQQPTDRTRRCDLLLALADTQMKAASTQRARSTFLQAADTAKALGDDTASRRPHSGSGGGSPTSDWSTSNSSNCSRRPWARWMTMRWPCAPASSVGWPTPCTGWTPRRGPTWPRSEPGSAPKGFGWPVSRASPVLWLRPCTAAGTPPGGRTTPRRDGRSPRSCTRWPTVPTTGSCRCSDGCGA